MSKEKIATQTVQKLAAAKELAKSDPEKAKQLFEEAKKLKQEFEELKGLEAMVAEADEMSKYFNEPQFPADLPVEGSVSQTNSATPTSKKDAQLNPLYVLKYGDTDSATKQVLSEVYECNMPSYYQRISDQENAFVSWARNGSKGLTYEQEELLGSRMMSINEVKSLIGTGAAPGHLKDVVQESIAEAGGAAVPPYISNRIVSQISEPGSLRSMATVERVQSNMYETLQGVTDDSRYSSLIRMTPVEEVTTSTPETQIKFKRLRIPVNQFKAALPVSKNWLMDAPASIMTYLSQKFSDEVSVYENELILTGGGGNVFSGVLPGGTSVATGIETVNSAAASDLTWGGLIDLQDKVLDRYRQPNNTAWIFSNQTSSKIRKLTNGAGNYLWTPYQFVGGEGGNSVAVLMGYRTQKYEVMPEIGAGTYPVIFGNWSGFTLVDHVSGMWMNRYDDSHTDETNTVRFVLYRRVGGAVVEPYKFAVQQVAA